MSFVLKQDFGVGWRCPASASVAHFSLARRSGWTCGGIHIRDDLVMKKVTLTLMPAFPP